MRSHRFINVSIMCDVKMRRVRQQIRSLRQAGVTAGSIIVSYRRLASVSAHYLQACKKLPFHLVSVERLMEISNEILPVGETKRSKSKAQQKEKSVYKIRFNLLLLLLTETLLTGEFWIADTFTKPCKLSTLVFVCVYRLYR